MILRGRKNVPGLVLEPSPSVVWLFAGQGTIWGIPGNAERVVCLNPSGHMELVGPVLEGTHKRHGCI